jgi:hypothetical protein
MSRGAERDSRHRRVGDKSLTSIEAPIPARRLGLRGGKMNR